MSTAQTSALAAATKVLGADTTYSVRLAGSGSNFTVGQAYIAGGEWPRVAVKSYAAWFNYDIGISRVDLVREMLNPVPPGGGVPFSGEQTQNLFYSGGYAWNGFPPAPPEGDGRVGGGAGRGGRGDGGAPAAGREGGAGAARAGGAPAPAAIPAGPAPQSQAVVMERKVAVWSTPHGFIKAANANKATSRATAGGTEIAFTLEGKHRFVGIINGAGEVTSVQTWVPNPVMGDMLVETLYTGYRDFNGLRFPARIVQKQGGQPALDVTITAAEKNAVVSFVIPGSVYMAPATPAPITVTSQEVAPGVFYLTGGGAHSVAIAQRDQVVLIDLPTSFERGEAVVAKAKELIPGRPIRFVVNTHAHFDHSSGLRAAVAEDATVVTHESSRAFLQTALSSSRTLQPDRAGSRQAKTQGVGARHELTDGTRAIQLHQIADNRHAVGWLLVYLPVEKILIQADGFTPLAAGAPAPTTPSVNAQALADNIARLKLDVSQILSLHGPRVATMADLSAIAGVGRR